MEVTTDKNGIAFAFRDKVIDFNFGMMLIEQLALPNILTGKKVSLRGKEKYKVSTKEYVALTEALPQLSTEQIIKLIHDIFFAIKKIEDGNLISKCGLWCKYEHLFYDEKTDEIKFVVIPVSEDPVYKDELSFDERLKECVNFIAGYLPFNYKTSILEKMDSAKDLIAYAKEIIYPKYETTLLKENIKKSRKLSLIYLKDKDMVDFLMEKSELTIGKTGEDVDCKFPLSEAVSRLHCKIIKQKENFFIQDLDSLNHTYVNGEYVPPFELMELSDRDLITLGDVELRVEIS